MTTTEPTASRDFADQAARLIATTEQEIADDLGGDDAPGVEELIQQRDAWETTARSLAGMITGRPSATDTAELAPVQVQAAGEQLTAAEAKLPGRLAILRGRLEDAERAIVEALNLAALIGAETPQAPRFCAICGPGYRPGDEGCQHTIAGAGMLRLDEPATDPNGYYRGVAGGDYPSFWFYAVMVRRSDIATPAEISKHVRRAKAEREAAVQQYGQPMELPGAPETAEPCPRWHTTAVVIAGELVDAVKALKAELEMAEQDRDLARQAAEGRQRERDAARAALATAERERDEAHRLVKTLDLMLDDTVGRWPGERTAVAMDRLSRQYREALAELKQLRPLRAEVERHAGAQCGCDTNGECLARLYQCMDAPRTGGHGG